MPNDVRGYIEVPNKVDFSASIDCIANKNGVGFELPHSGRHFCPIVGEDGNIWNAFLVNVK